MIDKEYSCAQIHTEDSDMIKALLKLVRVLAEILLGFGALYFHSVHVLGTNNTVLDTRAVLDAYIVNPFLLLVGLAGLIVGLHGVKEVYAAFCKEASSAPPEK